MPTNTRTAEIDRELTRIILKSMCGFGEGNPLTVEDVVELLPEHLKHEPRSIYDIFKRIRVSTAPQVNPFWTDFRFQYFLDLKLNPTGVLQWWREEAREDDQKPIDTLIETVITELHEDAEFKEHVIVRNAYCIHGAADRDVTFMCYTDDGKASLGRYIRERLILKPWAATFACTEVGWNRGYRDYGGLKGAVSQ